MGLTVPERQGDKEQWKMGRSDVRECERSDWRSGSGGEPIKPGESPDQEQAREGNRGRNSECAPDSLIKDAVLWVCIPVLSPYCDSAPQQFKRPPSNLSECKVGGLGGSGGKAFMEAVCIDMKGKNRKEVESLRRRVSAPIDRIGVGRLPNRQG
ncbi:hypothetical protein SKAU_G00283280 [Synaphobranchus kaupii]|uniref:Uncharacterized protein n=1 Tax=Synaphobranchus kaupii TaxID=118154 RepID=A0A9Q1IM22_SYNKA|nr:hypothetical protein SKAU_G00283280 [Synaphobranchus kaupii]